MPCPYNVILGRDTALPSPLSCPRVQLELICLAETGISKKKRLRLPQNRHNRE